MKAIKTILPFVIGIAIGALGYHFILQTHSSAKPTDGLEIRHSTSQAERTAMEAEFAHQYVRFHRAKDIEGLMAMGKFKGVPENMISSIEDWRKRSFAQQIVGIGFRELNVWEIRKSADLSLPPLLECTISFAQNGPEDVISTTSKLGVESGHLYIAERAKK